MKNTSKLINTRLINDYIKDNHLTKKEFCKTCKISVTTYYNIINGKDFNLLSLFRIAKTVGVPIHRLFNENINE